MKQRALLFIFIFFLGCVVDRLLTFKHQLKNPVKYMDFNSAGVLRFHAPILHLEDIALLTGIYPTSTTDHSATYDFIRPENPNYSFSYTLYFKDKKLAIIDYPDVFYNAIESSFAFDSLSLFGSADLPSNSNWQVKNKGQAMGGIPTKSEILMILGPPSFKSRFNRETIFHYHYKHPIIKTKDETMQTIKISITFNNQNNKIVAIFLQFPDRRWSIDI